MNDSAPPPFSQEPGLGRAFGLCATPQEARARLYALYTPSIYIWARRAGLPEPEAERAVQEAALRAFRDAEAFADSPPGSVLSWLRRITHDVASETLRSRQGETSPPPALAPEDQDDRREILSRAFQELSRQGRAGANTLEAFRLRALDGEPAEEAARALGLSPAGVHVAVLRVWRLLRDHFGALLDLPGPQQGTPT